MKKLYLLVDVESTGVNFLKDYVFDIGALFSDGVKIIQKYQTYILVDKSMLENAKELIGHLIDINIEKIYSSGLPIVNACHDFVNFILQCLNSQSNNEQITLQNYNKQQKIQMFFVGHNVYFDYNMILQTFIKAKETYNDNKTVFNKTTNDANNNLKLDFYPENFENIFKDYKIDTIELAKYYLPGLSHYSLQKIVDKFNLCPHLSEKRKNQKHSALLDCEILAALFHYLKSMSPFEDLVC